MIRLTVSEIRQKVFQASGTGSLGAGSLPGQLFHHTAACALQEDHPACWRRALNSELNAGKWLRVLYGNALGPELSRLQPSLSEGADVMTLWHAVESFALWFSGLAAEAKQADVIHYDERMESWLGADDLFLPEPEVTLKLREPGWRNDVIVNGRADQLIRIGEGKWCVVEFKLGKGHPEADAAQACLYHELLGAKGSAALVHFGTSAQSCDTPEEVVFAGDSIQEARPKLMALIGAMAGVTSGASSIDTPRENSWPRKPSQTELELGEKLVHTLREYRAEVTLFGDALVGPSFIRFLLQPGRGVDVNRIARQSANLQVRLQIDQEPMISRTAKGIAVDVQRPQREYVSFESLVEAVQQKRSALGSSYVLDGLDVMGKIHFVDLAQDAPHLLVGGVPGGGKSEWLRSAVASLVVSNTPETLRLVIIDPKKNAFTELNRSEFLWSQDAPVDSNKDRVIALLEALLDEMRRRYDFFSAVSSPDLADYLRRTGKVLPRLVCVVDEYADLLIGAGRGDRDEIETGFLRLAQMGRAAGVHLILATQRPSRQIVTGVLKANIPGRVALRVNQRCRIAGAPRQNWRAVPDRQGRPAVISR